MRPNWKSARNSRARRRATMHAASGAGDRRETGVDALGRVVIYDASGALVTRDVRVLRGVASRAALLRAALNGRTPW